MKSSLIVVFMFLGYLIQAQAQGLSLHSSVTLDAQNGSISLDPRDAGRFNFNLDEGRVDQTDYEPRGMGYSLRTDRLQNGQKRVAVVSPYPVDSRVNRGRFALHETQAVAIFDEEGLKSRTVCDNWRGRSGMITEYRDHHCYHTNRALCRRLNNLGVSSFAQKMKQCAGDLSAIRDLMGITSNEATMVRNDISFLNDFNAQRRRNDDELPIYVVLGFDSHEVVDFQNQSIDKSIEDMAMFLRATAGVFEDCASFYPRPSAQGETTQQVDQVQER